MSRYHGDHDFATYEGQLPPDHAPWELISPTSELARAYDGFLDRVANGTVELLPGYDDRTYRMTLIDEVQQRTEGAGYDRSFGFWTEKEAEAWQKREAAKPRRFLDPAPEKKDRDWKSWMRTRKARAEAVDEYRVRLVTHVRMMGRPFWSIEIRNAMGDPPVGSISGVLNYLEKRGVMRRTGNHRERLPYRGRRSGPTEAEWILRELYEANRRIA